LFPYIFDPASFCFGPSSSLRFLKLGNQVPLSVSSGSQIFHPSLWHFSFPPNSPIIFMYCRYFSFAPYLYFTNVGFSFSWICCYRLALFPHVIPRRETPGLLPSRALPPEEFWTHTFASLPKGILNDGLLSPPFLEIYFSRPARSFPAPCLISHPLPFCVHSSVRGSRLLKSHPLPPLFPSTLTAKNYTVRTELFSCNFFPCDSQR